MVPTTLDMMGVPGCLPARRVAVAELSVDFVIFALRRWGWWGTGAKFCSARCLAGMAGWRLGGLLLLDTGPERFLVRSAERRAPRMRSLPRARPRFSSILGAFLRERLEIP